MSEYQSESAAGMEALTPRQLEVLALLSKGLRNQEICELLQISTSTVKVHVAAVLKTLGATNRTEAAFEYQAALDDRTRPSHEIVAVAQEVGRPAIAVVPFENRSLSDDTSHLAAALHEDLATRLGSWRWFPILAPAATAGCDPSEPDLPQLRDELGASYAVLGTVRKLGEQLRVSVQLLELASAQNLWSGNFDAPCSELFELQDRIGRDIVAHIAPTLLEISTPLDATLSHPNFEAWNLASKALWHVFRATPEDSRLAVLLADRAIEVDDRLVIAWYARAAAHYQRVFHQWAERKGPDLAVFRKAAQHCVDLDPTDSAAHEIAGFSKLIFGDHADAIAHLERAVELNPSNAQAYSELGQTLAIAGRPDEGIAHLEEALRLLPAGNSAWSAEGGLSIAHFMAGRFDQAEHWARRTRTLDPSAATPYAILAAAQAANGDKRGARETLDSLARLQPDFDLAAMLRMSERTAPLYGEKLRLALGGAGIFV